jgi:hypothetical protein
VEEREYFTKAELRCRFDGWVVFLYHEERHERDRKDDELDEVFVFPSVARFISGNMPY